MTDSKATAGNGNAAFAFLDQTHREIDAARDDDEGHADGDDADERGSGQHVQNVIDGGEVRVEDGADHTQQNQAEQWPEPL